MKKLLFILLSLNIGTLSLHSQEVDDVLGTNNPLYDRLSIRSKPLFNKEEIEAKSIRSCTITEPRNYYNRIDTLFIFNFDRNGNIEREIRFNNTGSFPSRDTIYGSRTEKRYYNRIDSTVEITGGQKIVTKYYVWVFNSIIETEEDTGYIKRMVYDDKGQMISFKMNGTPDYFKFTFCGTGITFNHKYRYDEKGRLIYFQDLYWRKYNTYEHHAQRLVVSVYDSLTKKRETRFIVHISSDKDRIIEKDDFITTLTRLDKGSGLFSKISAVQKGKGFTPSDYLLVYEYFDNPSPKEKLIVIK